MSSVYSQTFLFLPPSTTPQLTSARVTVPPAPHKAPKKPRGPNGSWSFKGTTMATLFDAVPTEGITVSLMDANDVTLDTVAFMPQNCNAMLNGKTGTCKFVQQGGGSSQLKATKTTKARYTVSGTFKRRAIASVGVAPLGVLITSGTDRYLATATSCKASGATATKAARTQTCK